MTTDDQTPDPSAEMLRRWQEDGDPDALSVLLANEITILKHMIHAKGVGTLSGSASTSDIAQEAVMGLLKTKQAPTFDNPHALRGYLWRSAWHLLVKRFEARQRRPLRIDLEDPDVVDKFMRSAQTFEGIERSERALALGLAMNLLAKEDRELIRLVYFEGKDIATAGAAVGLSRDAASSRLSRGRRLMADRLTEWSDLIG